jgi:hypothetical protein
MKDAHIVTRLRALPAILAGAFLMLATTVANAAYVGPAVLFGDGANSSLGATLNIGDAGVVVGIVEGNGVDFTQTLTFTANGPRGSAAGASVEISGLVGISNLMYSLNGSAFTAAPGVITGALLAGPNANTLVITGLTTGSIGGNYKADIAVTPIPGAILLLGPALAGLGYVGYRRRSA